MQKDEAIKILARHLMQCGMMMPAEWVQKNGEGSEFMQAYEMAMDALKNEPVRCKDCKHWNENDSIFCTANRECRCTYWKGIFDYCKPDDFCSYEERKDYA